MMINPVTGGRETEAELRAHLGQLRHNLMAYKSLDRITGGMWTLTNNIIQLENALKGADMSHTNAEYEFLRRNASVNWNSGVPTWEHWELENDTWTVTTYEISVDLTNPRIRTDISGDI
jgi:hypothetical protein